MTEETLREYGRKVYKVLHHALVGRDLFGSQISYTGDELAEKTGLNHRRQVCEVVKYLRQYIEGGTILGDGSGYILTDNDKEITEAYNILLNKARSMLFTAYRMKRNHARSKVIKLNLEAPCPDQKIRI